MNLSYGVLHDVTSDRALEGFVEEDVRVVFVFIQHQVEGSGSGTVVPLLPILRCVSPYPRISGGTRVDMFNKFRARLSSIIFPLPSSICFSKAFIEWILVSRPMLVSSLRQRHEMFRNSSTHIDTNACS